MSERSRLNYKQRLQKIIITVVKIKIKAEKNSGDGWETRRDTVSTLTGFLSSATISTMVPD